MRYMNSKSVSSLAAACTMLCAACGGTPDWTSEPGSELSILEVPIPERSPLFQYSSAPKCSQYRNTLTWKLANPDTVDSLTRTQVEGAISNALETWSQSTNVFFTKVQATDAADLTYQFGPLMTTPTMTLGDTGKFCQSDGYIHGATLTFNNASGRPSNWSVSTPPANCGTVHCADLQSVVLHETGHALGLGHSGVLNVVMSPAYGPGFMVRSLLPDDEVAIGLLYDQWVTVPGAARDIGVGADGSLWVIGTTAVGSSYRIYKWTGSQFQQDMTGMVGVRIAGGPTGIPFIVMSSGTILKRTSDNPSKGSWTILSGCGKDIGVGADGSVWLIDCDTTIKKYNGSSFVSSAGLGKRVTVDKSGIPWVVGTDDHVYRGSSSDPTQTGYTRYTATATDIAADNRGSVYITGTDSVSGGHSISAWNGEANRFETTPGGATEISAYNTNPFVINSNYAIYRRDR